MAGESAPQEHERSRSHRLAAIRGGRTRLALGLAALAVLAAVVSRSLLGAGVPCAIVVGALALRALTPSRQEVAWRRAAEGERVVGRALDALTARGARTLHDRRTPRSRVEIDHVLVAASGVWTVDGKRYRGRLEVRGTELWVAGRNRSALIDDAEDRARVVGDVLVDAGLAHVPVRPALCLVGVEWPLLLPRRQVRGVRLLPPRRLAELLGATDGGVLTATLVARVVDVLERELRRAAL